MTVRNLTVAAAALMLTAGTAFAAPCATGTTSSMKDKSASMEKSSKVDGGSTTNVTPGAKAESPGTVGAMNNVGANTATSASDVAKQQDGKPTAADAAKGC